MDILEPRHYTVAWIAPLEIEARAALGMLDKRHKGRFLVDRGDDYVYLAGEMCGHNIIIATLPAGSPYGTASAASLAAQVKKSFPNLWFGLLVGVAAGLPDSKKSRDIRLGDVLVGVSEGETAGLVSYDLGKETEHGFQLLRGGHSLATTETIVRSAIGKIRLESPNECDLFLPYYEKLKQIQHDCIFKDPGQEMDHFFDESWELKRKPREKSKRTQVWYGPIGSGEKLMKNAQIRDEYRDKYGLIGLEMEAAGVVNTIPVGVVRGVCSYGDKRKNKDWQPYAAVMAAAFGKAILKEIAPRRNTKEETLSITNEKLLKIRQWLSAPDPSANYQRGLKVRQANTGLWFLQSEQYKKWKVNSTSFIWLHGIPGCGKTILSSTVIEDILQHCVDDPGKAAAYYFDFKDSQKQSSELMVKSLITQLSQQCIRIPPLLDSLFGSSGNGQRQPSFEGLLEALQQMSGEFLATYIILDALDECADQEDLMAIVETVATWKLKSLHIIVTSRKERDIESSLDTLVNTRNIIPLQSVVIDEDIRKYVHHRISVDKKLKKWRTSKMQKEIEVSLMKGAHGMFRWAVCQLDSLGNCVSLAMLRRSLERLPPTLDETYERILCAIHEDYSTHALRILRWLAFSLRPLSLEEIAEVVAVDPESRPMLDKDEVLIDPLDALKICGSLLTMTSQVVETESESDSKKEGEESPYDGESEHESDDKTEEYSDDGQLDESNNGTEEFSGNSDSEYESNDKIHKLDSKRVIALAHYSVKEYLTSNRIQKGPAKKYSLQESESNTIIANSCIGYLLQFQDAE